MRQLGQFINNEFIEGAKDSIDVINPATAKPCCKLECADSQAVEKAVASAKAAFPAWQNTPPLIRARIMFKYKQLVEEHADEFVELLIEEHGKTKADCHGELIRGLEVVEFACGAPHLLKGYFSENVGREIDSYTMRQALGVCVGITPFNFPTMVPMWMFPMALICGNTFILKPSEKDPSASNLHAKLLKEAGLPDGVFNVLHGAKDVVTQLITHEDVKAVSFVGSTPVAEIVYSTAAKHGKRCQALGGAKNHSIVMPDADLDQAVNHIIGGAFGSAGGRCMAVPVAVTVGEETSNKFIEKVIEASKKIVLAEGHDPKAEVGPTIDETLYNKIHGYIKLGQEEGANLVLDRSQDKPKGFEDGYFIGPCVFDNVTPNMRIYKEEIFGPVLCVVRAPDFKTALKLINDHEYGNGTSVFTRDGGVAREFAHQVQAGMVGINVPVPVPMSFHSFGGWKRSLFGDLHIYGPEGVQFYTKQKNVTVRWPNKPQGPEFVFPTMK